MSKLQKSRLGRGLSSLISISELPVEADVSSPDEAPPSPVIQTPASQPQAAPNSSSIEIPVDRIAPNPHQPRRQFNDQSLADLAASLKSNGLVQPIIVRQMSDGYQLVAGERRLRAAKLAGLSVIPAIVRDIDSFTQAQLALVENIHREDLNPIDRAGAYRSLIDQLGLTQAELATRLGEDRSAIANFLRLLELPEPVKGFIRDGQLSLGHAKILAGVTDVLEQERMANLAVQQGLSVRNLERLVQARPTKPARQPAAPSFHIQDLEKSIARQLGMRAQIHAAAKGKGRLVIHYGSLDQFDQLLERLNIQSEST